MVELPAQHRILVITLDFFVQKNNSYLHAACITGNLEILRAIMVMHADVPLMIDAQNKVTLDYVISHTAVTLFVECVLHVAE